MNLSQIAHWIQQQEDELLYAPDGLTKGSLVAEDVADVLRGIVPTDITDVTRQYSPWMGPTSQEHASMQQFRRIFHGYLEAPDDTERLVQLNTIRALYDLPLLEILPL